MPSSLLVASGIGVFRHMKKITEEYQQKFFFRLGFHMESNIGILALIEIDIKVEAAIMGEYEKLAVLGTHKIASLSELWYYYHLFQKNISLA